MGAMLAMGYHVEDLEESLCEKSCNDCSERNTVEDHGGYGGHGASCTRFSENRLWEKSCYYDLPNRKLAGGLLLGAWYKAH